MLAVEDIAVNESAKAFHMALADVDVSKVTPIVWERNIPRKLQASIARKLFTKLGLKKWISVTAPNYSMAHSVDVHLVKRRDNVGPDGFYDMESEGSLANRAAAEKVEQILLKAFPNTDNRSEYHSDYFDFKWSID